MNEAEPSPEQEPRLTDAQEAKLRQLCLRYQVEYSSDHYFVYPPDSFMMPGWAEGYVGGFEIQKEHPTIFIGVSPEGESHS